MIHLIANASHAVLNRRASLPGLAHDSLYVRLAPAHLNALRAALRRTALRRTAPALRIDVAEGAPAGRACDVELHGSRADLARAMSALMTALPCAEFGPTHGVRHVLVS